MPAYQIRIPSCVYAGEGSVGKLKEIIQKEAAKSVLVFTDKGIVATGLLKLVTDELEELGVRYTVFDDLKAEPAYTDVEGVLEDVKKAECDFIVAM